MTVPTCGTPHYDYSESLCTEPAGHYIRDRDPHAAPLIIDGRQCGGLAWDEPEPPVTDRHTVNSITSDALDELYADLDQAEAAIARVRAELDRIEDFARSRDDSTTGPYLDAVDALRATLDQPAPAPAATEATEPAAWTPPPPGDRREQLPDHLLALIEPAPYLSTACQTADLLACAACFPGSGVPRPQYDELREHAERLHNRCRINHKFTGQLCACGCHGTVQTATPPAATEATDTQEQP